MPMLDPGITGPQVKSLKEPGLDLDEMMLARYGQNFEQRMAAVNAALEANAQRHLDPHNPQAHPFPQSIQGEIVARNKTKEYLEQEARELAAQQAKAFKDGIKNAARREKRRIEKLSKEVNQKRKR